MAFALQRVLPTSPIYRGPNPMHIEVQICAHKGSKALHTSQRTCAFALGSDSGEATGLSVYPHKIPQATGSLAIRTRLSGSDARKPSNWTLQPSAQEFPSNWTVRQSAQVPQTSNPRVYAKQDDGMHLHFHSIQKGRISTSSQVDWI